MNRELGLNALAWALAISGTAVIVLAIDAVLHHVRVWGR